MAAICYSEPFADWLEQKVEFLFEDIPSPECGQNKPIVYPTIEKQQEQSSTTTQSLLQEFETVLGDVEACHQIYPGGHLTLTPPQSPPPPAAATDTSTGIFEKLTFQQPTDTEQLLLTLDSSNQQYSQDIQTETTQDNNTPMTKSYFSQISNGWNAENISLAPLVGDVDFELAAVDEYVRSCAEDMSPSSPSTSSNSSYNSDDSNDDPEWTINTSTSSSSNSDKYNNKQLNQRINKNRNKPYSRPAAVDKKIRKKEQNKNAATRYRQKKKAEIKEIVGEEQELIDHNEKLNDQVKDLQREIGYLKGLMRDLFKAKGLIK
ncbi:activating transcription factor of chaperone isoform X2 [Aphidius gifuensis]|uniref:activating transcription factor of chaperone isoform X2 n=1 Tax=Aphidius gifuensis TaxID=684658 RepID=UPI001CDC28EB|nr:activating transcription factor of chaperone isoform X2 [Aphidius gifuensis]